MIYKHCAECSGPLLDVLDVSDLTERHQAALSMFVDKYKKGALEHGDLTTGKQWTTDMIKELVDFNFYAIFQMLELLETIDDSD